MIQPKYYILIFIRLVLILANGILIFYLSRLEERLATIFGLGVLMIFQFIEFFRYISKTNHYLLSFLSALKYEGGNFDQINMKEDTLDIHIRKNLKDILDELQTQRVEAISKAAYLKNVVDQVEVGLMAVDEKNTVHFINEAALKMLNLKAVKSVDSIGEVNKEFAKIIRDIMPGEQGLFQFSNAQGVQHLSVKANYFITEGDKRKIVSFQNIRSEIESTESESWQRLIRVLTHEINNSLSPIISLAKSLEKSYADSLSMNKNGIEEDDKTVESLRIISSRSEGLVDFVQKYRDLTPKGKLNKTILSVSELFYEAYILFGEHINENNIDLQREVYPESLTLFADKKYIVQILLNLLLNAKDAICFNTNKQGLIRMKAFQETSGKIVLEVSDNGVGIPSDELEQVFVPFYTTKEKGSGIGLSLSRQMMQKHNGSLLVSSEVGVGTSFSLVF